MCELTGSQIIEGDGKSLVGLINGHEKDDLRMVVSEQYTYLAKGGSSLGRMVRYKNWKYITYSGFEKYDILFECKNDPKEHANVISWHPDVVAKMKTALEGLKSYDEVMVHERWLMKQQQLLSTQTDNQLIT